MADSLNPDDFLAALLGNDTPANPAPQIPPPGMMGQNQTQGMQFGNTEQNAGMWGANGGQQMQNQNFMAEPEMTATGLAVIPGTNKRWARGIVVVFPLP